MLRALVWGFLTSQALVGLALTVGLLSEEQDPIAIVTPLIMIGGVLLLYAFISGRRAASADRLGGPVSYSMAQETTKTLNERYDRFHKAKEFGEQFSFSLQLVITSIFLGLSAWLVHTLLSSGV